MNDARESPPTPGPALPGPTLRAKRRLVVALLILFALWPLAHHQLVEHYRMNPWRLFGWAMYTVPIYEPELRFYGASSTGRGLLAFPADSARSATLLRQFIEDRSQLGRLVEPDELARELFARHPSLDGVVIEIRQPIYDDETRSAAVAVDRYPYRRPAAP